MNTAHQPLVSIVMPTYNHAQFIGEAISSVLNQTYKNFELIIVDNYSQDNTQKVVDSFSSNLIRYFKFRNNGIIAGSRNFAMGKARGEYIAFLDSDDLWFRDKIAAQIQLFEKDPAIGLTFCPFTISSPEQGFRERIIGSQGKEVSGHMYEKLILYNFITSSSVMIRSSVKEKVGGFNESFDMRCVEDFDLWLRIARKYKISGLANIMGVYRIHSSNLFKDGKRLERTLTVIQKHYNNSWISYNLFKKARAQTYFREGWNFAGEEGASARSFFYAALRENGLGLNMIFMSLGVIALSLFPPLCKFFKRNSLDKKIGSLILNS